MWEEVLLGTRKVRVLIRFFVIACSFRVLLRFFYSLGVSWESFVIIS